MGSIEDIPICSGRHLVDCKVGRTEASQSLASNTEQISASAAEYHDEVRCGSAFCTTGCTHGGISGATSQTNKFLTTSLEWETF